MKIITLDPENPDYELLQPAVEVIRRDGVIGYPTETVYGLGANAFSSRAVEKVYQLKARAKDKPLLVIAANLEQVTELVALLPERAVLLADTFWPGPLTMVLDASPGLPPALLAGGHKIGIRIPGSAICLELIRRCGVPITSTSANISGQQNPVSAGDVLKNFGDKLDLIINGGPSTSRLPSTVIAVENDAIKFIREGAIPKAKIEQVIGTTDEK